MAIDRKLFFAVRGLGRVLNARNAQGQDPSAAPGTVLVPYNSPRTGASRSGVTIVTGDFMPPRYAVINNAGTMGAMTAGIPRKLISPAGLAFTQSAFAAGDNSGVGAGVNTNFSATPDRTRNYGLTWIATETNLARGVNPLLGPNGRLMEFGWDAVTAFQSFTFTQQSALQKVRIRVPDFRGANPVVPGITDSVAAGTVGGWAIGVFMFYGTIPTDADQRLAMPGYWIGQVPCSGSVVSGVDLYDDFDPSELAVRGLYYPSTFQNFDAGRAACEYKGLFIVGGGGESNQGPTYASENLSDGTGTAAPGDQPYFVSVGGPSKVLGLRRGTTGNKPHDPRTCQITSAVVTDNGVTCTVTFTVTNYHTFIAGSSVYIDDLDPVITGLVAGAYTVAAVTSATVFTITAATGTYSGGPSTSGVVMLNVMTTQEWWVGKQLDLGTYGQVTIERLVDETGTATGIEIDKTLNIATPVRFQIAGVQRIQVGINDDRGYCYAPSGLDTFVSTNDIGGPIQGFAAGSNGVFAYGPSGGQALVNIPEGLTLKGNIGATADQKPYIDPFLKLSYGLSGPEARCFGPGGDILGWANYIGPWRQGGVTQRLLDPSQKFLPFYNRVPFGQSGEGDETGNVKIAYSQNMNIALVVFTDIDQFLCIDFRQPEPIISVWVIFGQRITAIGKAELFRPVAQDGLAVDTLNYIQDTDANVGDVLMIALQSGDILEVNQNFFSDYCTRFEVDDEGGANFRGTVTTIDADSMTTDITLSDFYQAGASPTSASAIVMVVDSPWLSLPDRAIEGITLSGGDRYATIDVATDNHGIAPGSWITVSGVVGTIAASINGTTQWPVTAVPFSDAITIDGGAPGAFTGSWTSGGVVTFPTFSDLFGSYVGMNDGFDFGTNVWTGGPPFPGMTVCINPIYCICEGGNQEYGANTTLDFIESIAMGNEAYTAGELWSVRLRVVPSGQQWTVEELDGVVSDYPGYVTSSGTTLPLVSSISGNSIRLRMEWLNMAGGNTQLNGLSMQVSGQSLRRGSKSVDMDIFPQEDRRADPADILLVSDLNTVRGTNQTSLRARPGTRLLTVHVETRPVEMINQTQSPIADYQASLVYGNFVLVTRPGGQAFLAYSDKATAAMVENGFLNGTVLMVAINGGGALMDAVPYNGY